MEHGHAAGAGETYLFLFFLAFLVLATPVMVYLLARRAWSGSGRTPATIAVAAANTNGGETRIPRGRRYDLLRIPLVKRILKYRAFQFILQLPNALIFAMVIVAGIWGTQLGDMNFATVITWLIWWAIIIFTFLFFSRLWCMVCPLVSFAEWIQRGTLWGVRKRVFSLNRKWPKKLRNFWIPTFFFIILTWMYLFLGLASNPLYTALVTIFLFIAPAIVVSLIYERRTFCRYVCPIGGVIGVYSMNAPLELRNHSDEVCKACKEKACYRGNDKGYGCPVLEFPQKIDTNAYCTLCTECIKTCPHDNISLSVRPFLSDLWHTKKLGFDVAAIAVLLLGITVFQTLEMVGPWTEASDSIISTTGLGEKIVLTISYLLLAVLAPLAIFSLWSALTRWLSGNNAGFRTVFLAFSFAFLPIALVSHLAHNLVHFFEEGAVAIPVISDPLGWGWNLFGTAFYIPGPLLGLDPLRLMQMILVTGGYLAAVYAGWRVARGVFGDRPRAVLGGLVPMLVLMIAFAGVNLWLLNLPMGMRE